MKLFALLFTLCVLTVSMAQATQLTQEQGNKFYQSCVSHADPRLLPGTQPVWCQCTAKNMMQNLTFEDVQGVAANSRPAVNKMVVGVYTPCLQYPVHDDVYQECQKQGVPNATCECLASNMSKYTASEAQRLIGGVLSQTPNAFDPLAAIKQTPEFEAKTKEIASQCANGTLK